MRIDANDLRRHYESLSDGELRAIKPAELTDVARKVYEAECARRNLTHESEDDLEEEIESASDVEGESEFEDERELEGESQFEDEGEFDVDTGPPPEWAEDAAVACSFSLAAGQAPAQDGARARAVLRAAGIPCSITLRPIEDADGNVTNHDYCVMVPGALTLHATSVLDRDLFNERHEEDWRTHLEALSDKELRALDPGIFCAGLLDRVARMRRVYAAELTRRGLKK